MEFPRWAIPAAAALTVTGLLISGCGQEPAGGKQQNAAAGTQQSEAPADPSEEPSQPPADKKPSEALEVASVTKLGKVVTNGEGKTLYRFENDTARPPASTCLDDCAKKWPPVEASDQNPELKGVEAKLVGKVKRPDGKWQVTLGGWPLYKYAQDESPGDVKGQGVGGTWFAAAPDGKKAGGGKAAEASPSPTAGNGSGGGSGNRWSGWTTIKVKDDPKFGKILVDGKGRTMYRYDKDKPKVSNCSGACRKAWPIVVFNGFKRLKLEGVDRSLVSFIERKDGRPGECQVLINGWPMYYYEKDVKAGDTKGQGVGNVWWLVSSQGKKITAGDSGGGGGYGGGY